MKKKRMKKGILVLIICLCMIGSVYPVHPRSIIKSNDDTPEQIVNTESLIKTFEKYTTNSIENSRIQPKTIDLPWLYENSQILEWWINIKYNGQTFQKQIPLDIFDFSEKFLKHPEYGEILGFNIDEDEEEDVQIIAGFYWSVVIKPDGSEVRSLEKRLRMIQLQTGNYIDDDDASFEVWSELHVNYGLFKPKAKTNEPRTSLYNFLKNIFDYL